jgi:hypothetical protein
MLNNFLNFCSENAEWIVPMVMFFVAEIVVMKVPTKDPAGLTERIGKALRTYLETRTKNNVKPSDKK